MSGLPNDLTVEDLGPRGSPYISTYTPKCAVEPSRANPKRPAQRPKNPPAFHQKKNPEGLSHPSSPRPLRVEVRPPQPEVRQLDSHRVTVWTKIAEDHRAPAEERDRWFQAPAEDYGKGRSYVVGS